MTLSVHYDFQPRWSRRRRDVRSISIQETKKKRRRNFQLSSNPPGKSFLVGDVVTGVKSKVRYGQRSETSAGVLHGGRKETVDVSEDEITFDAKDESFGACVTFFHLHSLGRNLDDFWFACFFFLFFLLLFLTLLCSFFPCSRSFSPSLLSLSLFTLLLVKY